MSESEERTAEEARRLRDLIGRNRGRTAWLALRSVPLILCGGFFGLDRTALRFWRAMPIFETVHRGGGPAPLHEFQFLDGGQSEPPGPGRNAAGLALFRYRTRCGRVFGHTGSIPAGYTQLVASTPNGNRSVSFTITIQAPRGGGPGTGERGRVRDSDRRPVDGA
jgi:hypothetical protein